MRALSIAAMLALLPAGAAGVGNGHDARVEAPRDAFVGTIQRHRVEAGETLIDLAVEYGVGYIELMAANQGVRPWVPEPGREIVIPTAHLLPDAPREGIVVNVAELRLYWFGDDGEIETYPIGLGAEGYETPIGPTRVTMKRENPTWYPPESVRRDRPGLPGAVPPGPHNPLGSHALNLGWPRYVIHGTNRPFGIGRFVSRGCVRMYSADVARLFDRVEVGTPVRVIDEAVKVGWSAGNLYVEVHPDREQMAEIAVMDGSFTPNPAADVEALVAAAAGDASDECKVEVRTASGSPVGVV